MKRRVVGNDVTADHKDLVIITGANQGGKSTFLRSVGLAQLMMQCGLFVAAEAFCSTVCDGLFTHYKREEDAAMQSGKFDEELGRMSDIVDHLSRARWSCSTNRSRRPTCAKARRSPARSSPPCWTTASGSSS